MNNRFMGLCVCIWVLSIRPILYPTPYSPCWHNDGFLLKKELLVIIMKIAYSKRSSRFPILLQVAAHCYWYHTVLRSVNHAQNFLRGHAPIRYSISHKHCGQALALLFFWFPSLSVTSTWTSSVGTSVWHFQFLHYTRTCYTWTTGHLSVKKNPLEHSIATATNPSDNGQHGCSPQAEQRHC